MLGRAILCLFLLAAGPALAAEKLKAVASFTILADFVREVGGERVEVASLVDLGLPVTMEDADIALRRAFEEVFGATETG